MSREESPERNSWTDKEIEAEAKAAINSVILEKKGAFTRGIKPEFRKAFPFGPRATVREKTIWEKTVMAAEAELHKWPRPLTMMLLAVAISTQAALADGLSAAIGIPVAPQKPCFAILHPKLVKAARKIKHTFTKKEKALD